jgi:hypothetical protein
MSAYLVVVLSVLASATATLTLNLLTRLEWRRARAWTRAADEATPAEPGELLEARQGACGCLTVTGAIALLHEQGYLPFGQLGGGGELLADGEAAAAVWPAPPDRIAAVQFGSLSLGPAHQQPASHLDAAALLAANRTHRNTLASQPTTDPAAQPEVFELVYPLTDPPPAQHPAPTQPAAQPVGRRRCRRLIGRAPNGEYDRLRIPSIGSMRLRP